jgi:hypothetical protein
MATSGISGIESLGSAFPISQKLSTALSRYNPSNPSHPGCDMDKNKVPDQFVWDSAEGGLQ